MAPHLQEATPSRQRRPTTSGWRLRDTLPMAERGVSAPVTAVGVFGAGPLQGGGHALGTM